MQQSPSPLTLSQPIIVIIEPFRQTNISPSFCVGGKDFRQIFLDAKLPRQHYQKISVGKALRFPSSTILSSSSVFRRSHRVIAAILYHQHAIATIILELKLTSTSQCVLRSKERLNRAWSSQQLQYHYFSVFTTAFELEKVFSSRPLSIATLLQTIFAQFDTRSDINLPRTPSLDSNSQNRTQQANFLGKETWFPRSENFSPIVGTGATFLHLRAQPPHHRRRNCGSTRVLRNKSTPT